MSTILLRMGGYVKGIEKFADPFEVLSAKHSGLTVTADPNPKEPIWDVILLLISVDDILLEQCPGIVFDA